MKPDKYDGKGSWETFQYQFENCCAYNGWNKVDKAAHLRWSLSGTAAQLLWGTEDATYDQLVEKLKNRFGGKGMEEKFQNELRCRRRARNETLRELAQDVQRLMALAYPGERSSLSEHIARDAFLSALDDADLELKVREREPIDLDAAVKLAQRFEVFKATVETSSNARHRVARQVTDASERTPIAEDFEARIAKVESALIRGVSPPKGDPIAPVSIASTAEPVPSYSMYGGRRQKRNRNVNKDDSKWKEDITKQCQELQSARQVAEGQAQRLNAENEALNKEVGRLRYLSQMRSNPTWTPTPANVSNQPVPSNAQQYYY